MDIHLNFLERIEIKNKGLQLTEPSGLALAVGGDGLWTIGDETNRVFHLGFAGEVHENRSIDLPQTGLEDIASHPNGKLLYAVCEPENQIIELSISKRDVTKSRRLADMAGYDPIERFFAGDDPNQGLEGITWNEDTGTLFCVKEGDPGLLIEVGHDLKTILGHSKLRRRDGFVDGSGDKIDYSGICYDSERSAFWIVSDEARSVYLYRQDDGVLAKTALKYRKNGEKKKVKGAEGIAIDVAARRLYVVNDPEAGLYVFELKAD